MSNRRSAGSAGLKPESHVPPHQEIDWGRLHSRHPQQCDRLAAMVPLVIQQMQNRPPQRIRLLLASRAEVGPECGPASPRPGWPGIRALGLLPCCCFPCFCAAPTAARTARTSASRRRTGPRAGETERVPRVFGNCWLACERWQKLGIDEFWRQRLGETRGRVSGEKCCGCRW